MNGRKNPLVERREEAFQIGFDRSVRIEVRGALVTSDAGLFAFRKLNEALGLTGMAAEFLADNRTGRNNRHVPVAPLRQSFYSRLAGYEYGNEAEQLCNDSVLRCLVSGGAPRNTKQPRSVKWADSRLMSCTQWENLRVLMVCRECGLIV